MDNIDEVLCPIEKSILNVITNWKVKRPEDDEYHKGGIDHAYEIFQSITKHEREIGEEK